MMGAPPEFLRIFDAAESPSTNVYNRIRVASTVSVRLPDDLLRGLDVLRKELGQEKADVLRDVIRRGIAARRLEVALEAYRKREVSIGRASEIAGIPITVFLDEMQRAGILLNYTVEDLRDDLDAVRRL